MFMVKVSRSPLELGFEVGSIEEAIAALSSNSAGIQQMFAIPLSEGQGEAPTPPVAETTKATRKPGRPKNQPDPASASAPPPAPVPANVDTTIPAFLHRPLAPPAPAPVAPPPAPSSPPPPQVNGVLAGKIIADLNKRKSAAADEGKGLVDWLVTSGVVIAGSSYDEALGVINVTSDAKLAPVAQALGLQ